MEVGEEGDCIPIAKPGCYYKNQSSIKMGIDESHFNISLIVRDKVSRQCPHTAFLKRKESRSGIEPRPFCLPA